MRAAQLDVIANSPSVLGANSSSEDEDGLLMSGGVSSFWDADVCVTVTIDL